MNQDQELEPKEELDEVSKLCVDCGKSFTLTASEIQWYGKKGMTVPKRCKPCVAIKKQKYASNTPKAQEPVG